MYDRVLRLPDIRTCAFGFPLTQPLLYSAARSHYSKKFRYYNMSLKSPIEKMCRGSVFIHDLIEPLKLYVHDKY